MVTLQKRPPPLLLNDDQVLKWVVRNVFYITSFMLNEIKVGSLPGAALELFFPCVQGHDPGTSVTTVEKEAKSFRNPVYGFGGPREVSSPLIKLTLSDDSVFKKIK